MSPRWGLEGGLSPSYRHVTPLGLNAPNPLSRFTPSILKIPDKIGMQVPIFRDSENQNLIRTIIMSSLIGFFNSPVAQSPSRGYGRETRCPAYGSSRFKIGQKTES